MWLAMLYPIGEASGEHEALVQHTPKQSKTLLMLTKRPTSINLVGRQACIKALLATRL